MAICESATRFDNNSYYKMTVNEETESATIIGEMNGEPVEFTLGGGGGGSSDFSTAQVTFQCNLDDNIVVNAINFAYLNGDRLLTSLQLYNGFNYTIPAVLYKSKASSVFSAQGGELLDISLTGNATIDPENDNIVITGDCTITISD